MQQQLSVSLFKDIGGAINKSVHNFIYSPIWEAIGIVGVLALLFFLLIVGIMFLFMLTRR